MKYYYHLNRISDERAKVSVLDEDDHFALVDVPSDFYMSSDPGRIFLFCKHCGFLQRQSDYYVKTHKDSRCKIKTPSKRLMKAYNLLKGVI